MTENTVSTAPSACNPPEPVTTENSSISQSNPAEIPGIAYIDYETFSKVDLRVAEIIEARLHPKADKLLVLKLKVGDCEKQICAGIRAYYTPEQLVGKRIVIVNNLEPRALRGEKSEGMLLAASVGDGADMQLTLVTLDNPQFPSGAGVH